MNVASLQVHPYGQPTLRSLCEQTLLKALSGA